MTKPFRHTTDAEAGYYSLEDLFTELTEQERKTVVLVEGRGFVPLLETRACPHCGSVRSENDDELERDEETGEVLCSADCLSEWQEDMHRDMADGAAHEREMSSHFYSM